MSPDAAVRELDGSSARVLRSVQVNMPWGRLPEYMEAVIAHRMNLEIGFEAADLDRVSRAELSATAARLHGAGCRLTLHGPFWDLSPGSRDPLAGQLARLRLQQFLDAAALLAPVQVVCHTGYDPKHHGGYRAAWCERAIEVFSPLAGEAARLGVPFLLENVYEHTPAFFEEFLPRLGSPGVGFCLDTGHAHAFSRSGVIEWARALAPRLFEAHLHDNDGTADSHRPVGRGTIDFAGLFAALSAAGARPLLTLEPHTVNDLYESLSGCAAIIPEAFLAPARSEKDARP